VSHSKVLALPQSRKTKEAIRRACRALRHALTNVVKCADKSIRLCRTIEIFNRRKK
jgi:hypothetical protein